MFFRPRRRLERTLRRLSSLKERTRKKIEKGSGKTEGEKRVVIEIEVGKRNDSTLPDAR